MKFQRISFRCFGPFREQTLDLSTADGLHVVYGPNEAGKSAALRGLRAFLFGFPAQSGDDFLFKYNQFRVHAALVDAVGRTLECIRRKGNKDTLLLLCEIILGPPAVAGRGATAAAGTFPSGGASGRSVTPRYAAAPRSPARRSPLHSAVAAVTTP